jgi:AAA family ATP:ADP antiporter
MNSKENFQGDEKKKFFLLALVFLFLIGVYWLLRSVKDSILANTVGLSYQPIAKMVSLCFLIPLILAYSKLVDVFKKHLLFYFIGGFYAFLFLFLGYLLKVPGIGLDNTVQDPSRLIGWVSYLGIESFGSLMVALFWSFVASSTSPESAKVGYPKIIFGAQFGSITGPFLVTKAEVLGIPNLMYISFTWIILILVLIAIYVRVIPGHLSGLDDSSDPASSKKNTGMLEGIRLLFKYKYIAGIFCVATFYEIVGTILDFQMKVLARQVYTTPESFATFMANFGMGCNLATMAISLVGTSFIMRKWGLTVCIVLFPITVGAVVTFVYFSPSKEVFFAAMIIIKCFTYALNNPAKEIMYIPTSKDIKFKTKGWIDMFGSRSMKAIGSLVNNTFKESTQTLLTYGTVMSLGVVFIWIFVAAYVGKTFEKLTKENKILS